MESEFITLDKVGEEEEWLQNFLKDIPYWPKPVAPLCIHCDSQETIGKAGSMMYNGKSRHIRRRHSTVKNLLSSGIIIVDYVKSKDNVSDPLTKGLSREGVERTSKGMGLRPRMSQHGVTQNSCTASKILHCFRTGALVSVIELMHWLHKQMQPFSKRHADSWKDMIVHERMESLMNKHEFTAKVEPLE
ncbi:hypothetical protein CQW23_19443 [Capsicum baccatum]|uniref:Uncharacterized protein n=1 Tax=Capsicum baccatum TaxID=33114 RepID=A0A2G2W5V9_CAPBA|nr:hypothetical protein CQW23_19443 [Capsicum baccatum]